MAFKLTYTDGAEVDYDNDTVWEVDDGVLKLGKSEGDWSVLVSPSHWAVIEVGGGVPEARGEETEDTEDTEDSEDSDDSDGEKKSDD